ncbi:MAG: hypothetical protein R6U50_15090 [Desulfobacterales bacterium]
MNMQEQADSKLIPILREGIAVVKMILYKEFKTYLSGKHGDWSEEEIRAFSGAVINEIFSAGKPRDSFYQEYEDAIEEEADDLPYQFPALGIPLTDALRMQFLCDSLEGVDSEHVLSRARDRGILLVDREVPFPKNFLKMVRKIGVAHRLLTPQEIEEE